MNVWLVIAVLEAGLVGMLVLSVCMQRAADDRLMNVHRDIAVYWAEAYLRLEGKHSDLHSRVTNICAEKWKEERAAAELKRELEYVQAVLDASVKGLSGRAFKNKRVTLEKSKPFVELVDLSKREVPGV